MAKYSKDDIEYVAYLMREAKDAKQPFALLTGAGCSKSAGLPLASELMKEIEHKHGPRLANATAEQRASYGYCMGCLSDSQQRSLLQPYFDAAKINWAHIAIAGLMREGYVSRVLTFNFDNVLAKACGLAGLCPPIYDFAMAPTETTKHIGKNAIIHLHGQGHGFSLFNSEERTRAHAEKLMPLLRQTLAEFPLLVLGYSGDSDAVFPKILEVFTGQNDLVWTSFSHEPSATVGQLLRKADLVAKFFGGADADLFLVERVNKLGCRPTLFDDPYGHLLDGLAEVKDLPLSGAGRQDTLEELRDELRTAQAEKKKRGASVADLFRVGDWQGVLDKADKRDAGQRGFAYLATVEQAAALGREGKYAEAFEKFEDATKIDPDRFEAYGNWASALGDAAKQRSELALYEEAMRKYERAAALAPDNHDTFTNWAADLTNLAVQKNDPALFQQAIAKCDQAVGIDPSNEKNYSNFSNWGLALMSLAGLRKDLKLYDEALEKCGRAIEIRPTANTLNNMGTTLLRLWQARGDKSLLAEAERVLGEAESLQTSRSYNLACLFVLSGRTREARSQLEGCEHDGTLPGGKHLLEDDDLTALRGLKWFKDMVARR